MMPPIPGRDPMKDWREMTIAEVVSWLLRLKLIEYPEHDEADRRARDIGWEDT